MTYSEISTAVAKLIKKYDERDPFRLCRAMGIKLIFQPMGTAPDAVKGFFLEKNRIRVIVINSDLPEIIQRIIGAHELCHAEFHRKSGIHAFHEVAMFDQTSEFEKDANLFAAELLLEDGEVLDALNQDVTFFSAAAQLRVPMEMLDFKFRLLKWKGYKMLESPIQVNSNFMRNMEVPDDADYYS